MEFAKYYDVSDIVDIMIKVDSLEEAIYIIDGGYGILKIAC